MKKIFKILLWIIGVLSLLIIALILFINFKSLPTYTNEAQNITVSVDSAGLAEGKRIAITLCVSCHRSNDGRLGGAYMPDAPAFGKLYSSNITQHPEHGITDYTDGELIYLLRTGIKKDGSYAPPWMTKFPFLSDEDVHNIVAFLRSDDPLVQPSDHVPPKTEPSFLAKALINFVFRPLPYPDKPVIAPDLSDAVAFGKYVSVAKFDCFQCHSQSFSKINYLEPEKSAGYFGGGNPLIDLEGIVRISANLTMDKETGLGNWSEEDFLKTLKTGIKPDGTTTVFPMTPFPMLTETEISSIWAYLQTLPIIVNPKA